MLYGLLVGLFIFICFLLIAIILIQQGKSSMGIGGLGGGAQMLFGGSGGQDMFQKATWVMGALFMAGSLGLSIMKTRVSKNSIYFKQGYSMPRQPINPEQLPTSDEA